MPFATMATGLVPGSIETNGKKNNGDNEQGEITQTLCYAHCVVFPLDYHVIHANPHSYNFHPTLY